MSKEPGISAAYATLLVVANHNITYGISARQADILFQAAAILDTVNTKLEDKDGNVR